ERPHRNGGGILTLNYMIEYCIMLCGERRRSMGKGNIVSFLNMKGGVGKTTLCKEIGYFLYKERKKKVLFIDVDPQANLTQSIFKRFGYKQKQESTKDVNLTPSSASVSAVFNYRSIIEEVEIEDALLIIDEK